MGLGGVVDEGVKKVAKGRLVPSGAEGSNVEEPAAGTKAECLPLHLVLAANPSGLQFGLAGHIVAGTQDAPLSGEVMKCPPDRVEKAPRHAPTRGEPPGDSQRGR